ncbi:MAG: hypothetical protein HRT71_12285 [Flavobacteriales bacterium]|nr:hypothetical protein [Flavobacteriales bacterium]
MLFLIVLSSCSAGKIAIKTGIELIEFGSGGGFTGLISVNTLTPESKILADGNELKEIDAHATLEIYNESKELMGYKYNEPGNMYLFLTIKSNDKTNKIVWKMGDTDVDVRVTALHKKLMLLK